MKNPKVMVVWMQQQRTVDCGLFAIAYAVWKDSEFVQQSMRAFFTDCIKKRHLELFPSDKDIACVARLDTVIL